MAIDGLKSALQQNGLDGELLHGKTLAQLITARSRRMKEAEVVEIIERVGDALGFVHNEEKSIAYQKPKNR